MATKFEPTHGSREPGSSTKSSTSASKNRSSSKSASSTRSSARESSARITHEQIEERAKAIWRQHGCAPGEDERNWYEAETQLKRELGGK
ncbi:MAG: DUF2934 domain-containing protein [Sedimentisphaerales bacterium]|nr:DUF2934 domain-containing protein [Sedimentisphaerales bacterium]